MDLKVVTPYDTIIAYQQVWQTDEGRIVLADLMRHFSWNTRSTYQGDGTENCIHREGQRSVLVHIGNQMEADPALAEETERAQY